MNEKWTVRVYGIENVMLDTGTARFTDFDLTWLPILEQIAAEHNAMISEENVVT